MPNRPSRRGRARLLGLGLDGTDTHTRVSRGEAFRLYNGSPRTHARMQERATEFMRLVRERGLSMDNISRGECSEILTAMGLSVDEIGVG
jgi:hypothetical protein